MFYNTQKETQQEKFNFTVIPIGMQPQVHLAKLRKETSNKALEHINIFDSYSTGKQLT